MRLALKVIGVVLALVVVLVVAGLAWVESTYQRDFSGVEQPDIHAIQDPVVIARGEYVANALAHCPACHAADDYVRHRTLPADLRDLRGGFAFFAGPFGMFHAANLTSDRDSGIGAMSDGELARAIRHGVDRNGHFAAFMAFSVGQLSDEDMTALVSYLRTLPPKSNDVAPDQWGFFTKLHAHSFEPNMEPPIKHVPPGGISLERGQYLANGPAGCHNCHSSRDANYGFAFVGARFAGNPVAQLDPVDIRYEIVAPNLTPDPETGRTGQMNEHQFIARMHAGRVVAGSHMPWENYQRMTEDDMRSIYRYLHSLPGVKNDLGPVRRPRGWQSS